MAEYVHGYGERENIRLEDQSGILEELIHPGTGYDEGEHVLEAGCGVGAQTVILAKRSPGTRFTAIDISEKSLKTAQARAAGKGLGTVRFECGDVTALRFPDNSFDHIFACFVLEHLADPHQALCELKRVLRPGGSLTAIEGDHGSCFWHPETAASLAVWNAFIKVQRGPGHDPNIGRRLYPLIADAGFTVQDVSPRWVYGDAGKKQILDGMVNRIIVPMVQTGRDAMLKQGLVDETTWRQGIADLERSGTLPDGTFFYTWFKAIAVKRL
ncbi:MAG: methyltransferase domain-containing protein [Chitinivibrionales bacterium]|nr:methyltransferase domain-containing protein [Chitinivibrionales bacterium]